MRTLYLKDTNTFYAPAEDECWVILAKAIMDGYAMSYANKIPMSARSQAEYDEIDRRSCAPVRRSILRNIKRGPLGNAVDLAAVYYGLEQKRIENKLSLGIKWKDNQVISLDEL